MVANWWLLVLPSSDVFSIPCWALCVFLMWTSAYVISAASSSSWFSHLCTFDILKLVWISLCHKLVILGCSVFCNFATEYCPRPFICLIKAKQQRFYVEQSSDFIKSSSSTLTHCLKPFKNTKKSTHFMFWPLDGRQLSLVLPWY